MSTLRHGKNRLSERFPFGYPVAQEKCDIRFKSLADLTLPLVDVDRAVEKFGAHLEDFKANLRRLNTQVEDSLEGVLNRMDRWKEDISDEEHREERRCLSSWMQNLQDLQQRLVFMGCDVWDCKSELDGFLKGHVMVPVFRPKTAEEKSVEYQARKEAKRMD